MDFVASFAIATGGHYITMLLADCIVTFLPSSFCDEYCYGNHLSFLHSVRFDLMNTSMSLLCSYSAKPCFLWLLSMTLCLC